jgi:hypothetical protein
MDETIRTPQQWVENKLAFVAWLPKRATCCEVGVWTGNLSATILEFADPAMLYLVDPWAAQPREQYDDPMNKDQDHWDGVHAGVASRFAGESRVKIIRDFSVAAASRFPDHFFDWVYIDANHAYEAVYADLRAWAPKVKPGGLLCGHDYIEPELVAHPVGVVRAVNGFIDETGATLECLSTEEYPDRWRSYALRLA